MAVAAIQAQLPNVMLVAEWNRLRPGVIYLSHIGGLIHHVQGESEYRN
jgi:hypothetical protein